MRFDYTDGDADLEAAFYILRHTACAACLTENGFMDCADSWQGRPHRGAERPQVSDWSARRVGKSLAVELPQVEFVGALRAPEDGTKASERSFSGANWL